MLYGAKGSNEYNITTTISIISFDFNGKNRMMEIIKTEFEKMDICSSAKTSIEFDCTQIKCKHDIKMNNNEDFDDTDTAVVHGILEVSLKCLF